eukprot:TRINITY_DN24667_c0_g1_i1.p1 TRINITY_DN24667_c0_g1~~TRINITY_DN24667_c0_g1_i1.p1  ORF type:complete len:301 (+),score=68.62 TRINITY_DN24667_c0_g1_i1:224-1126(+)
MAFDGSVFGSFILRSFLAELASKSFFLSAALTAWCPWEGVRDHDDLGFQACLVFLGSYVADVVRILLLISVTNKTWAFSFCDGLSCFIFLVLGIKAKMELSSLDARELRRKLVDSGHTADAAGGASADADVEKPKDGWAGEWNSAAFSAFSFNAESRAGTSSQYGSTEQFGPVDGALSQRPSDRSVSTVLAFLLSLLLVFLCQADDKSTSVLIGTGLSSAVQAFAALLGLFLARAVAVFAGVFFERQLRDERLLFLVSTTFFGLSFICLSQALLYLGAAASPLAEDARAALLSMFTHLGA